MPTHRSGAQSRSRHLRVEPLLLWGWRSGRTKPFSPTHEFISQALTNVRRWVRHLPRGRIPAPQTRVVAHVNDFVAPVVRSKGGTARNDRAIDRRDGFGDVAHDHRCVSFGRAPLCLGHQMVTSRGADLDEGFTRSLLNRQTIASFKPRIAAFRRLHALVVSGMCWTKVCLRRHRWISAHRSCSAIF